VSLLSRLRSITRGSTAPALDRGASGSAASFRLRGGFTLPVAARWNDRGLPAGDYRFFVSSESFHASVCVQGEGDTVVFFAASVESALGAPGGQLCLIYDESGYRVRSLKLRDARGILYFDARRPAPAAPGNPHRCGVLFVPLQPA